MAYKIRKNKSVEKSVRKVVGEQIDKAIAEIEDDHLDSHETIHQVRKRCKKIRGLIRLIRPAFADYSRENKFIRNMARDLSFVRDAQSTIESLDLLAKHYQSHVDNTIFARARSELLDRRRKITEDSVLIEDKIHTFLGKLKKLRKHLEKWHVKDDGFSAVAGGMRKTYRRGRKAMPWAYDEPNMENFHEWRKRVKYHLYHMRLLREIWPEMIKAHQKTADELADLLGDEHDLAVLRQVFEDNIDGFGDKEKMSVLLALIDRRRRELQLEVRLPGERLFAEDDDQLVKRFGSYWAIWQAT
ncbi:MAG: CHAD domain-containing protein [Desulforhopalus sp.]